MSYTDVVEERGQYRAVIEIDQYPHEPDHEVGCPVLRVEPSGWGGGTVSFTGYGSLSERGDGLSASAEYILQRFVQYHGWSEGIDVFARFIRIFHGGTVTTHSGQGWREPTYVAYTTERMVRDVWGNTDGTGIEADIEEWAAYVEGEVYVAVIEQRVVSNLTISTLGGEIVSESSDEDWHQVECFGGLYGERWAREAAVEELSYYAPEVAA